jgi:acyl carrier protein
MERSQMMALMNEILARHGKSPAIEEQHLRDINFRSMDFSELALRIEMKSGFELNFDAAPLRSIETVSDMLDFLEEVISVRVK